MSAAIHIQTTILPGGKIEITSPDLPAGKRAIVSVTIEDDAQTPSQPLDWTAASADDIIADLRAGRVEREEEVDL